MQFDEFCEALCTLSDISSFRSKVTQVAATITLLLKVIKCSPYIFTSCSNASGDDLFAIKFKISLFNKFKLSKRISKVVCHRHHFSQNLTCVFRCVRDGVFKFLIRITYILAAAAALLAHFAWCHVSVYPQNKHECCALSTFIFSSTNTHVRLTVISFCSYNQGSIYVYEYKYSTYYRRHEACVFRHGIIITFSTLGTLNWQQVAEVSH